MAKLQANKTDSYNSRLSIIRNKNYNLEEFNIPLKVSLYSLFIKRFFDFIFSSIFIVLLSPLLFSLFIITKITSKGPGLFFQKRMGQHNKEFYLVKFRSMKNNSEPDGPVLSIRNDPRVTKWGKIMRRYYLDELPQLINIWLGEMSFIGPRPERKYFIYQIRKRGIEFDSLLQLRPGLSSLGQVKFGYASNIDEILLRMKYERLYLTKISLILDFKIIVNTILRVVRGEGV